MSILLLRKLHRWVALLVALQVVLWCISGATFAWLDHDDVSGAVLVRPATRQEIPTTSVRTDPRPWLSTMAVHEVRLQSLNGMWVYRAQGPEGVRLFDAARGTPVRVDEHVVRAAAAARYAGRGRISAVGRHAAGALEARKHGAAWSVHFDDEAGTTLWFSADDARLLETRTDTWRLYDLFWMLHTMDYRGRDDFNHPLVVLFASAALGVALTGALLIVRVFRPRRSEPLEG